MMRIAMVSEPASPLDRPEADGGGQHSHVADLSTALAACGHEIRVYTGGDAGAEAEPVRLADGVRVLRVPTARPRGFHQDRLTRYLKRFGQWLADQWRGEDWAPDVVHAHSWTSGVATLAALATLDRSRPPVAQTYHALGTGVRHPHDAGARVRAGFERVLGGAVDRVVAMNQNEVSTLLRLRVPRSRIVVVPAGVDLRRFTPSGPAMPRRRDIPRILAVGRLLAGKGHADLVRAMPLVPEAECVIVGGTADGHPEEERLRALAQECAVDDRVRLAGRVSGDELPRWYRSADVVASTPWVESSGRTPLEAMACGVPVVGTAVGGLSETVVDGLTGDLVQPRDPRALGHALRRLLADQGRRLSYGVAALDRARRLYSWHRAAEQLSTLYSGLLAERGLGGIPTASRPDATTA